MTVCAVLLGVAWVGPVPVLDLFEAGWSLDEETRKEKEVSGIFFRKSDLSGHAFHELDRSFQGSSEEGGVLGQVDARQGDRNLLLADDDGDSFAEICTGEVLGQ